MSSASFVPCLGLGFLLFAAQPANAVDLCEAPAESWQPRSAVIALAQRNGWTIERLKIDDGCYEIIGRDADGHRFKAKVHPASLQVLRMKQGRRERERDRDGHPGPASTPVSRRFAGSCDPHRSQWVEACWTPAVRGDSHAL